MQSLLLLGPLIAAGIGGAAAYGVTHKDKRIHFVEEDNLSEELDKFDISVSQAETCPICNDEVDSENVGAVIRVDDEYRVICDKSTCLDTYDLE